jgi:hypothetical protein
VQHTKDDAAALERPDSMHGEALTHGCGEECRNHDRDASCGAFSCAFSFLSVLDVPDFAHFADLYQWWGERFYLRKL